MKILEIRDRSTFIVAMAVKIEPQFEDGRYLLSRAGYGKTVAEQSKYIFLCRLPDSPCLSSPQDWGGRTMPTAHKYIYDNWDDIKTGQVIDVEYILGEKSKPKLSESITSPTYG